MRFTRPGPGDKCSALDRGRRRIQADLENKGVAPEFSQSVANRISAIASTLAPEEYGAVLDGVALAYGVHREGRASQRQRAKEVAELARLVRGFAEELRKLEEGVRILSAYLSRIRQRTDTGRARTLH